MSRLGYPFTPLPKTVLAAVGRGDLSESELATLAYLYDRSDYSTRRTKATLVQIAEGTAYRHRIDTLSKQIRRLRDKGWLDYESQPGRQRYEFQLFPEPKRRSSPSERDPSLDRPTGPSGKPPRPRSEPSKRVGAPERWSEPEATRVPVQRPTDGSDGPRLRPEPSPAAKPSPKPVEADAVRPSQTSQKKPFTEEETVGSTTTDPLFEQKPVVERKGQCDDCPSKRVHTLQRYGSFWLCADCVRKRRAAVRRLGEDCPGEGL